MDWLIVRQARMEDQLAQRHLAEGSLVLYDLTSTYFEGRKCPLAAWGHSRDERSGNPQIVFGLLTNQEGCPVAVEVFEGNTADPKPGAALWAQGSGVGGRSRPAHFGAHSRGSGDRRGRALDYRAAGRPETTFGC